MAKLRNAAWAYSHNEMARFVGGCEQCSEVRAVRDRMARNRTYHHQQQLSVIAQ
jgi:hypothetical protein